jgi:hypothetical protein
VDRVPGSQIRVESQRLEKHSQKLECQCQELKSQRQQLEAQRQQLETHHQQVDTQLEDLRARVDTTGDQLRLILGLERGVLNGVLSFCSIFHSECFSPNHSPVRSKHLFDMYQIVQLRDLKMYLRVLAGTVLGSWSLR